MFGNARHGAQAYSNIGIETGVFAASPHQLTLMLFDGAKMALNNATMYLHAKKIADKGRSISHAIRIIGDGLQASLNKEAGGEVARNLDELYSYMCNRLLLANVNNNEAMIHEVIGLIDVIRDAWVKISPTGQQVATIPAQAALQPAWSANQMATGGMVTGATLAKI